MTDTNDPEKRKTIDKLFRSKPGAEARVEDVSADQSEPEELQQTQTDIKSEPEDPATEKAVDDIVKSDADAALKAQDDAAEKEVETKQSFLKRLKSAWVRWWTRPRTRNGSIAVIVLALITVGAVPFTRYNVAGLVLQAPVTVTVVDSQNGAPVSGATVKLGGKTAETDASGKAVLHVHAGSKTLQVSKPYYKSASQSELVALSDNTFKAKLVALGHQVPVKVVNKITGKPVANAVITVQGAKTKTSASGIATVVLASSATTQTAAVGLDGYNTASITITATGDVVKNTFSIVPAGKLYFLSNLSGKIDVVKTNLDGTDRQTVLAGTGNEDRYTTSLLASRDWKYLALLSKRSGDNASLYLIDTTNGDKLSTMDEGNANFTLVGWSGDRFVYKVDRSSVQNWQPNAQALKSFDPTTGNTLLLDQTQASGSGQNDYARQQVVSTYLIGDQVVYSKTWYGYGNNVLSGKSSEFDSIGSDGSGHKTLKTFTSNSLSGYGYFNLDLTTNLYEPSGIYIEFSHDNTNDFYDYDDGKVTSDATMTADKFNGIAYNTTFLLSPSGHSTFWSDPRDGKNTLFTGDADGKNQKQIASLSDYNTYGWFTDDYLLTSKSSSELYVMPVAGGTPLKITDYYKPAINYGGYGGGYGGL